MDTAGSFAVLQRSFTLYLQVQGLRPSTISHYTRDVRRLADFFDGQTPDSLDASDLRTFLASLQSRYAPKTVRETQLAIRKFFRFLLSEGETGSNPTDGFKLINPGPPEPQPTYTEAETKRLLLACSMQTNGGIRDRALLLVLFDTGVRVGELVSMQLPDWEHRQARVSGKTGVRNVPMGVATLQAVERYVRKWGISEGLLWRGKKGPLTGSGVLQLVKRLSRRAGVDHKGVHAFRRASAAQMKRLGMQDSDILEIMGWKDVTMLRRYTAEVAEELAHDAHRRASPGDALGLR